MAPAKTVRKIRQGLLRVGVAAIDPVALGVAALVMSTPGFARRVLKSLKLRRTRRRRWPCGKIR